MSHLPNARRAKDQQKPLEINTAPRQTPGSCRCPEPLAPVAAVSCLLTATPQKPSADQGNQRFPVMLAHASRTASFMFSQEDCPLPSKRSQSVRMFDSTSFHVQPR